MDEIFLAALCVIFYLFIKLTDGKPNMVQYYYKWYSLYAYGFFMATIMSLILVWRGRDFRNLPIVTKWMYPMTKFHGMTWHLENAAVMNSCGSAVIISNHQSSLDILGTIHASPTLKMWIPTAKRQLLYLGPMGLLGYLIGAVFINRTNPKDAIAQLKKGAETMTKYDMKMWIFPEGTRNVEKKVKLLPFKKGAFWLAVSNQTPIIPVVFSPYYFAGEDKAVFENGGHVIMRCLEPVPTTGLTKDDVPALTERLHSIVLNAYEDLSKEVLHRFPGSGDLLTAGE